VKLTRHNGRTGKHGTYNPKHNDRRFDVEHSEHIDARRTSQNIYWDLYREYTTPELRDSGTDAFSFEDVERQYYSNQYSTFVAAQNERNEKARHPERNRTIDDLLKNPKTCPEESIYQIGTMEDHVPGKVLLAIVQEFFDEMERRFGSHVRILDWALHVDEGTPHIQERHVFECRNRYGELCPQQEKALEELEIPLPHPDKPKGKHNNRKQSFDAICRTMLFEICAQHGLLLDREPEYGGRDYLEKQDYILAKQKEKLTQQETALQEITLKLEDTERLLEDIAEKAYEQACKAVAETVCQETQKQDLAVLNRYQNWIMDPERRFSRKKRDILNECLDTARHLIRKAAGRILERVHGLLQDPKIKQYHKEQLKERTRESLNQRLERIMAQIAQEDRRRAKTKKHTMER